MKIICLADTHGHHRKLRIPDVDLLLFAGDMEATSFSRLADFSDWLASIPLPIERKIIIAGNHDGVFELYPTEARRRLDGIATYLENSSCTVAGLKVYGTPVSLAFNNWFFNIVDDGSIQAYWDSIPPDTITDPSNTGRLKVSKSESRRISEQKLYLNMRWHHKPCSNIRSPSKQRDGGCTHLTRANTCYSVSHSPPVMV
jgi:hypothetical protein